MKKVPLGLEFSLLINVEVFINSAKLIILVKINFSQDFIFYSLCCPHLTAFCNNKEKKENILQCLNKK